MRILEKTKQTDSVNSIGAGSSLEGTINSQGDIRIDGALNGTLIAKGRLVLGEGGRIKGDVECGSAIIAGELKANIKSKEMLTLKETARLYGDIETQKLSIEAGAMFSGKCVMASKQNLKTIEKVVSNKKEEKTFKGEGKEEGKTSNNDKKS